MDEFGIRPLCPTPRGLIDFVRKDAHGDRDVTPLTSKKANYHILPIETGAGKRRVRQPGERDVVENVVSREAFGLPAKTRAIIS